MESLPPAPATSMADVDVRPGDEPGLMSAAMLGRIDEATDEGRLPALETLVALGTGRCLVGGAIDPAMDGAFGGRDEPAELGRKAGRADSEGRKSR